ncbi:unnamed protein product [Sphagnum jensenii]|uniref:Uncharacterized protein n=1 Tax=Sphagnum jensenii TaxID=128206 RepID=A0ABP0WMA4_9BRYO
MWPPMFNPLINLTTSPKPISKIAQARIVTDHKEPLDEDEDYSEKKHNPKMPRIVPTKKLYHDRKGRPSSIGDASRELISGRSIPINNNGGGLFGGGGNGLPKGRGNGPPRGGGNNSPKGGSSRPPRA